MSLARTARALSGGHLHAGATTNVACAQQILSQRANCYLSQLRPAAAVCVSGMVMKTRQGAHAKAQNDRSAAIPGHSCHGRPGRARHHLAGRIQPHSDERPGRLTGGFCGTS
jgi:hypothetical protein